jgi:hypothetical protein
LSWSPERTEDSSMTTTETIPTPESGLPRSAAAYEDLLPEIQAVPEESLSPILIDIPTAVTTVLGALSRIGELRPEIVETLRKFDFAEFDRLEQYTLAVSHAHALHRAAHEPKASIATMGRELAQVRDVLLLDARSLAAHRLINAERLAGCRPTPGYRALAYDVLTLVEVLREAWDQVHDRTPVTLPELNEAAGSAERLLTAVGLRDQAAPKVAEATVLRRKAFALFLRVYARARAAVQYLRAEIGDADEIAPSLYAGRAKRRKAGAEAPEGTAAPAEAGNGSGAAPVPAPSTGSAVPAPEGPGAPPPVVGADTKASSSGDEVLAALVPLLGALLNGRGPPTGKA